MANASPKRGSKVYEKPWVQSKANVQERPLANARGSESALKNVIEDKYASAQKGNAMKRDRPSQSDGFKGF